MTQEEWENNEEYLNVRWLLSLCNQAELIKLFQTGIEFSDILNGRIEGGNPPWVEQLMKDINIRAGWKVFITV